MTPVYLCDRCGTGYASVSAAVQCEDHPEACAAVSRARVALSKLLADAGSNGAVSAEAVRQALPMVVHRPVVAQFVIPPYEYEIRGEIRR